MLSAIALKTGVIPNVAGETKTVEGGGLTTIDRTQTRSHKAELRPLDSAFLCELAAHPPASSTLASLCYHLPQTIAEGTGVQVNPPSTVLSRDEKELDVAGAIAHPTVAEIKSIWAIFLKFALGESFIQCWPPSLVL